MQDDFYCVLKLVTGEEIFSTAMFDKDKEGKHVVILENPVIMKVIKRGFHSGVKIEPWMKMSDEEIFTIPMDKVITISEITNQDIIKFYKRYLDEDLLEEDEDDDGSKQVTPNQKMGYLGTVSEARTKLEEIYKLEISDQP